MSVEQRISDLLRERPEYINNPNAVIASIWNQDFNEVWSKDMDQFPATMHGFDKTIREGKVTKISTLLRAFFRVTRKMKLAK